MNVALNQLDVSHHASRVVLEYLPSEIALIQLGFPGESPVTFTIERFTSLQEAISDVRKKSPKGLVITGSSEAMFSVGGDVYRLLELKDTQAARQLALDAQELYNDIATLPFPTVAAISGYCLGGACELALACKYRLISDHQQSWIGLPQVKIGLLPCFGGTQRLPRLVGARRALDLILRGENLRPQQALDSGLVHEVVPAPKLFSRAEKIAMGQAKPRRQRLTLDDLFFTYTGWGQRQIEKRGRALISKTYGEIYPAPPAALEAILTGLKRGVKVGAKLEADLFGKLLSTPESQALLEHFAATHRAKAIGHPARKFVEQVSALVLGAGNAGAGLAGVLAQNECQVILKDTSEETLNRGLLSVRQWLAKRTSLTDAERRFALNRIETTIHDSPNLGSVGFAFEAIYDDLTVKQKALAELARALPADAIIATLSSFFSAHELQSAVENPARFIVAHSPAPRSSLMELARGDKTSNRTLIVAAALCAKLGKVPLIVADTPGFLVDRMFMAYALEAVRSLEEGYSVEEIDNTLLSLGFAAGALRSLDEFGLERALTLSRSLTEKLGPRFSPPTALITLVEKGRKGRRNGVGFYNHSGDEPQPASDLRQVINSAGQKKLFGREQLKDRLLYILLSEAIACLDEGVAGRAGQEAADQIDLAATLGLGFPQALGGILRHAERLGAKEILKKLDELSKEYGSRFGPNVHVTRRAQHNHGFRSPLI